MRKPWIFAAACAGIFLWKPPTPAPLRPIKPVERIHPAADVTAAPVAPIPAGPPANFPEIPAWLEREAIAMNRLDPNPAGTETRYRELASKLSHSDLVDLVTLSLTPGLDHNLRFFPVYLMGLNDQISARHFTSVAVMETPAEFELLLSLRALREVRKREDRHEITYIRDHARSAEVRETAMQILEEMDL